MGKCFLIEVLDNMNVLAVLVEPANYTLDLINNIYTPKGVDYVFLRDRSLASDSYVTQSLVLGHMSFIKRLAFWIKAIRKYDAFVINSYVEQVNLEFIVLNLLFFHKPFAIESDTELQIPENKVRRFVKKCCLGALFRVRYCFGFPGGAHGHVQLFSFYGMDLRRIIVMPMVVDNKNYMRQDNFARHRPFRFGYVGRLIPLKQVEMIIEALPKGCALSIVGDGEERDRLESLIGGRSVKFHGAVFGDAKKRILETIDCLVLYSSYEAWGLVVNEALANGIPVIVSDKVGCRADLVDGATPTGIVVPWNDVSQLSNAMSKMATDESLWSEFSRNAQERMRHWNYDYYGAQFDRFIKEVSCFAK